LTFFKKKLGFVVSLFFIFIGLSRSHDLGCELCEIIWVGSALIIGVTYLSCQLGLTRADFSGYFFTQFYYFVFNELSIELHYLFSFEKNTFFIRYCNHIFFLKFSSSTIIVYFFYHLIKIKQRIWPSRVYNPSHRFLFLL
jgi:hypothetical protein